MALASAAGAALVWKVAKGYTKPAAVALVLVVAMASGVLAGMLVGAALEPILIVGLAFGSCFAAGSLLVMLARPQT